MNPRSFFTGYLHAISDMYDRGILDLDGKYDMASVMSSFRQLAVTAPDEDMPTEDFFAWLSETLPTVTQEEN